MLCLQDFTTAACQGPNDLCDHKKRNLLLNMKYHRIYFNVTRILFLGERGTFLSVGNISGGSHKHWTTCVSLHKHCWTSQNSSTITSKFAKKNKTPQNTEPSSLQKTSIHRLILYIANSVNMTLTGDA